MELYKPSTDPEMLESVRYSLMLVSDAVRRFGAEYPYSHSALIRQADYLAASDAPPFEIAHTIAIAYANLHGGGVEGDTLQRLRMLATVAVKNAFPEPYDHTERAVYEGAMHTTTSKQPFIVAMEKARTERVLASTDELLDHQLRNLLPKDKQADTGHYDPFAEDCTAPQALEPTTKSL